MKGLEFVRAFARQDLPYEFSSLEARVLRRFFTNTTQRVFFMQMLPANIGGATIAMYSRLKNPRGIRGIFVDKFLPELLVSPLGITEKEFGGKPEKALAHYGVKSLQDFRDKFPDGERVLNEFLVCVSINPGYLEKLTKAERVRRFLQTWLDAYGHNSIARGASVWVCFEQISILAAKSIEWGRPGAGYIELSTRYVDMGGKDCYPIADILAEYGVSAEQVRDHLALCFDRYREWQGENFDGPFPQFLRSRYAHLYADDPASLESGLIGETCDVLGNFLPSAALTSVGVCVSGEAFPKLLEHLLLDNTPENIALTEMVVEEAGKCGAAQFARHYEPTPWKKASWEYLDITQFEEWGYISHIFDDVALPRSEDVEFWLLYKFCLRAQFAECHSFEDAVKRLLECPRGEHDKLPNEFEAVSADFRGVMSFRSWRDLHRMGFSTHFRTRLTPQIGFYRYDKPRPDDFDEDCEKLHHASSALYAELHERGVPDELMEYVMPMGTLIGFTIGANLLQHEFSIWQRSKPSVNHEVRQIFLDIEEVLSDEYPWWKRLSRADRTLAYVFARGKKAIPLPSKG
ncbi:MAG: FAD-dependent thymidylate synthase [Candidatus Niyogibacteria bacterium]|nr:FAD-dependent thymidylate synthase [Candidatus Niyogibacteria bacterium]